SLAQVTKIFFPQRTGEEWPPPGRVIFHAIDLSSKWVGKESELMPVPLGPRKRVHSWAEAKRPARGKTINAANAVQKHDFMAQSSGPKRGRDNPAKEGCILA